ncbi:fatty acyl-AMP ligase [Microbispora sp. RL4-1S]|uniref:Fatty acyl-AMP ligase n=1 Tax=Microbispora oryzae TaxID=2806554 RepID=A0A941AHJ4_9ACTN|nr:fatty acyl-AMP ligase [Microbispora oryzae]MBP2702777.1 fatty acyl-AMP ligase [Microbispora oryzae]
MPEHHSFTALVRDRAAAHGDRVALVFSADPLGHSADETLTYAELDVAARRVAALLQGHGRAGDRVLLLNEPGTGFAAAFLGCLYAGMIAVPAPAPDGYRRQQERLAAIARDAGVTITLSETPGIGAVRTWAEESSLTGIACLTVDGPDLPEADAWIPYEPDRDTLAFLQYTSGSTGDPKGVMVDHENILANTEVFRRITGTGGDLRFGGWLPMYHDFGLIGLLLIPLCLGTTTVLMSPLAFVKRPHAWLRLLDRHRVNVSPAPNFAFDLCAQRIADDQVEGLDLSAVTHLLNGSEPIRVATLRSFAKRFAPYGLAPEALLPGYGMAEATLAVSCSVAGRGAVSTTVDAGRLALGALVPAPPGDGPGTFELPSSGPREEGVVIVDPASRAVLPDGSVGEIWIRGPQIARGYWGREDLTAATFGVRTAGGDGGYLRTGDLGVVHDGQLYVTGRIKELLIVRGRNLYPQDLEATVRTAHPVLARGVGAVFTVPAPDEEIVVVQECRARDLAEVGPAGLVQEIRQVLGREYGVAVGGVVLVRPAEVQRTTSGKIQRALTRDLFTGDGLTVLHEDLAPAVRQRYRAGRGV